MDFFSVGWVEFLPGGWMVVWFGNRMDEYWLGWVGGVCIGFLMDRG